MVVAKTRWSRPQALNLLALTVGGFFLASELIASPTVNDMRVVDVAAGTWGCYEVTTGGDLILYPYPQPTSWTPFAGSVRADEYTILGWRGFYEIRPGGWVALEPFSDVSTGAAHEESCRASTIH